MQVGSVNDERCFIELLCFSEVILSNASDLRFCILELLSVVGLWRCCKCV